MAHSRAQRNIYQNRQIEEKKREKWEQHEQTLNIFISVSSACLHFAMTDQGDMVASMLLSNSILVM